MKKKCEKCGKEGNDLSMKEVFMVYDDRFELRCSECMPAIIIDNCECVDA